MTDGSPLTGGGEAALSLPRPPGAIRTYFRDHPRWMDAILVALFLLGSAVMATAAGFFPANFEENQTFEYAAPEFLRFPQILLTLVVMGVGVAAVLLRRTFPFLSLLAVLAVSLVTPESLADTTLLPLVIVLLLYAVPVYGSVRLGWVGYGVTVLVTAAALVIDNRSAPGSLAVNGEAIQSGTGSVAVSLVLVALLCLLPVVIGINTGNRRRYTDAIIDRARQLARERDQRAQLAVAEERTRIAREMHDIVAHSVSVMVTLSEGAAQVVDQAPEDAKNAALQSAETGRSALREMRRLIGALRQGEDAEAVPELAPTPGIAEIPELVQSFNAAGLLVRLRLEGGTSDPESERAKTMELAIYRTVQEALTNALRYAGPEANVTVVVKQGPDGALVRIDDDGGVQDGSTPMSGVGTGHGLMGLSERLRVSGGVLEYGPRAGGGWMVQAKLPAQGGDNG